MRHFVLLCERATELLEVKTSDACVTVFDVKRAREANRRILTRYHIGSDRSIDLRPARPVAQNRRPKAAAAARKRRAARKPH
jgi:hypothetical protein